MSNERDELLSDLTGALNWASIDSLANTPDFKLAEKIIDAPHLAGYCKRRTVTTTEELRELDFRTVILDADNRPFINDGDTAEQWCTVTGVASPQWLGPADISLPATVLHEPEPVSEP